MLGVGIRAKSRLVPAVPFPGGFTPKLLIDPSVASSVTSSGGLVSQINDISGVGDPNKNFVQATSGDQPTYNAQNGAFNGQATLDFGGSQWMRSAGTWAASLGQPCTYFLVATASASGYFFNGVTGGARQVFLLQSPELEMGATAILQTIAVISPSTLCAYALIFNGASSALYQNASAAAIVSGNAGGNAQLTGMTLGGSNAATPGNLITASIGYLIAVTGATSTANISAMFKYLAARFAPSQAWT